MYKINTNLTKNCQPNITVVGFYPMPESEAEKDRARFEDHYVQLCAIYGLSGQLIFEPEEAQIYGNRPVVAIQEYDEGVESVELGNFEHPGDAVYIVGCSRYGQPSDYFPEVTHRVHITVPNPNYPMYGDQALAMTIYDKFNKERKS